MKKLTTNEIRQMWLKFFNEKQHHFLAPVSLIPVDDPSLLWINSGVATLKHYFDGRKTPPSQRLTNSQKAIRTNDIENVGVTARHQTMFEMLGNFSIGDYFKEDAIKYAWELLTSPKWFGIPKDKLYITVFNEDSEAYRIWTDVIKVKEDHIFALGRGTNFWDIGQGPCGPNTEIFFDRGQKWDPKNIGPKLIANDIENDRYIEIWNIVFSQFNNDGNNNYTDLPRKNIDTGAGLERLASIFQDTPTNFETDTFLPIINKVETLADSKYKYSIENYMKPNVEQTKVNTAFKVIADHVRASTFAIADGVFPGNKDRGYIVRRLIRRSSIYGKELGINNAFLYKLVDVVIDVMGHFYPYLKTKRNLIIETIKLEEEKFLKTLAKGYELIEKIIKEEKQVSAKNALLLFESFGFPIEQTIEISQKENIKVDIKGFETLLDETKKMARSSRKDLKAWNNQNELFTKLDLKSEFTGWHEMEHQDSKIIFMFKNNKEIKKVTNGEAYVILDKTPFYAEKGGQASDYGVLENANSESIVLDVQQGPNHENIHHIKVSGLLRTGDTVNASIDKVKRTLTMKNHSGTHLLHAALRSILGDTVMQSGSFNNEEGLRMDFTFNRSITPEELIKVEDLVNEKITAKIKKEIYFCSMNDAIHKYHALAFFAEKYDDIVRVVKFGNFSSELCGGTHVANTFDIEDFIITGIESKGSGLFRIKALTSNNTVDKYIEDKINNFKNDAKTIFEKYHKFKTIDKNIEVKYKEILLLKNLRKNIVIADKLINELKELYKEFEKRISDKLISLKLESFKNLKPVLNSNGINEIKLFTKDLSISELKQLADKLRNQFDNLIVILGSKTKQGNFIVVAVSEALQDKYKAIDIFNNLTEIETKGGGNANLAQGKYIEK